LDKDDKRHLEEYTKELSYLKERLVVMTKLVADLQRIKDNEN